VIVVNKSKVVMCFIIVSACNVESVLL